MYGDAVTYSNYTVSMSTSLGASAIRLIANRFLSGATFQALPSWFMTTRLATNPILPSGMICELVGGPEVSSLVAGWRELSACRAGDVQHRDKVLAGRIVDLPMGSYVRFSSRPTRISLLPCLAQARQQQKRRRA